MSYRLEGRESVQAGICRIAREQIDKALAEIDDPQLDRHERVHQVRKRCKKIRGLLRLVRPAAPAVYRHENAAFRDAAGKLSSVRDAQAIVETFNDFTATFTDQLDTVRFDAVRRELLARRDRITQDEAKLEKQLRNFRQRMVEATERTDNWSLREKGFDALERGFAKTYARCRKAMRAAYSDPTPEHFHEWRKRVKYHCYHLRILEPVWKEVVKKQRREAERLGEMLGDDHNLAVLAGLLQSEPKAFGKQRDVQALLALLETRRVELQALARPLGERLFAEKKQALAERFRVYWLRWRREQRSEPKLAQEVAAVDP